MPDLHHDAAGRRRVLRDLLAAAPAATQRELVAQLTAAGYPATQSSVSRDLRELGAVKTATGYALPAAKRGGDEEIAAVAALVRTLRPAGPNLLVVHTAIGAAQRVALALDRCGWPEIVGNVGGDDTVFTATGGAAAQRAIIARIERILPNPS